MEDSDSSEQQHNQWRDVFLSSDGTGSINEESEREGDWGTSLGEANDIWSIEQRSTSLVSEICRESLP